MLRAPVHSIPPASFSDRRSAAICVECPDRVGENPIAIRADVTPVLLVVELSVKKAAYADVSRAACWKSGMVLGWSPRIANGPFQSWRYPRIASWGIFSGPYGWVRFSNLYPGLTSWATLSRPYGTQLERVVLTWTLKPSSGVLQRPG